MILHIDMDAFFASIEQAINPRLKLKPLIVGSRGSKLHTVVCAASYQAKALGIHSGMSSVEAFKVCPDLKFVSAQQGKYIWTSEEILKLLEGYDYPLRYVSIDEFQLDIAQENQPQELAERIRQEIQQRFDITASVGMAKNCLLAKLASKINKPNGVTLLTEANLAEILGKTPVAKLCGVGEKVSQVLDGLGIKTCLDLYLKKAEFFQCNLGKYGLNLYLGLHTAEDFNQDEDESKPKSIGHSYTLPRASVNPGFIRAWIRLLAEMVARRLRERNFVANTVHLWLNGPEIAGFSAQKTFQQPTNDGFEITQRCLKIMAVISQNCPKIRALGVTCSKLSQADTPALFKEQKRRELLLKTIDKINSRHGEDSIYPAVITISRSIPK